MAQEKVVNPIEKREVPAKSLETSATTEIGRLSYSSMITTDSKDWPKVVELIEKNGIPESTVDKIEIKLLSFHFKNGYFPAKEEVKKGLHLPDERAQSIEREAGKIAFGEVLLKKRLDGLKSDDQTLGNEVTEREKAIIEKSGLKDEDVREVESRVNNALNSIDIESLKKEMREKDRLEDYYRFGSSKRRKRIDNATVIQLISASTIVVGLPISIFILTRLIEVPYFVVVAVAAIVTANAAISVGTRYYKHKEKMEEEKRNN